MGEKERTNEPGELPRGTIVRRKIRGIDRFYHQWRENGKTKSRYLKAEEIAPLRELIEKRKLEAAQRKMGTVPQKTGTVPAQMGTVPRSPLDRMLFQAYRGKRLLEFAHGVERFKPRRVFARFLAFLRDRSDLAPLLLNGPRGCGRTTLIRQIILALTPEERDRTVYLCATPADTFEDIAESLAAFQYYGMERVFIEGARLSKDFETFGAANMKIVVSSDISYNDLYAGTGPAYPEFDILDLTFISYAEHVRLLGETEITRYLETGGTLAAPIAWPGLPSSPFPELPATTRRANDFLLLEILANAANRPKEMRRKSETFVGADIHKLIRHLAAEIGESDADLERQREELLSVPIGLRFRHLHARTLGLLDGPAATHLGAAERKIVRDAILSEIRECLFEDLVWHETAIFRTTETTFVERIRFAPGAYGFAIADREELTCEILVATLAETRDDRQLRYLNDPQQLEQLEHRYGIVTSREVIYRGRNAHHGTGVFYRSARDYLSRLAQLDPTEST